MNIPLIQNKIILYENNNNKINQIHIEEKSTPINSNFIGKENKNKENNDYNIYECDSFNSELSIINEYINNIFKTR